MKKITPNILVAWLMVMLSFVFSSCSVVEGIFKAGVWVGVLLVVAVVGGIIWLISRAGGK